MSGKQAKILSEDDLQDLLVYASATRNPIRNQVIEGSRYIKTYGTRSRVGAASPAGPARSCLSERGGPMTPLSIVVWFARAYCAVGLEGCSSHSGRRTFITRAARLVHKAGGSLRDVQLLAGHRSIQTTQQYIDGDSDAQRKLVAMI